MWITRLERQRSEIENAKITGTFLGRGEETHGVFSAMIHLEGDGWRQSLSAYNLKSPGPFAGYYIQGLIEKVGCTSWEQLPGTMVRIKRESRNNITAIGHLIKDEWFDPEALLAELEATE